MKQVILSDEAIGDLTEIGDYIAAQNPSRAASYIGELYDKAQNIGTAPLAYPKRDDLAPGLRMAIHDLYVILFRVKARSVEIVRILHGARDLPRLLRD